MKICTIISPDKLSMAMFCNYFKNTFEGYTRVVDFNCLLSKDTQEIMFQDLINVHKDEKYILIKYKIKPNTVLTLPDKIKEGSNFIIKFDLFSMHPELIKDDSNMSEVILNKWTDTVLKLDKIA